MRGIVLSMVLLLSVSMSAQDVQGFVGGLLRDYPKARLLDIYKSCFQGYMGAEHLVLDKESVEAYLDTELSSTSLDELMPWYYEPCGMDSSYYRVSLRAVKEGLITRDLLLDAFVRSAASHPAVETWRDRWQQIIGAIDEMNLDLPNYQEDKQFIDSILTAGKYAISHSPQYREAYHPHYRIVERGIFERYIKPMLGFRH